MTRQDYELIARVIRDARLSWTQRWLLAEDFAFALQGTNPRFNESRFIAAAVAKGAEKTAEKSDEDRHAL